MTNRLYNSIEQDRNVFDRLVTATTKEEAIKIAEVYVPGYTEEEFAADILDLKRRYVSDEALDIEELGNVAGGVSSAIPNVSNQQFFGSIFNLAKMFF